MRILASQPLKEPTSIQENPHLYRTPNRPDSIESLGGPTWIVGKVRALYRRTLDFFRGILSRFFPIQPYTSVSAKRIDYQRIIQDHQTIYRVLVDDVSTDNEIIYTKKRNAIVVTNISFPDPAMRAHIGMLFGEILKKEEAECFATNIFDFAKLLWNCGYLAKGAKIRYHPESENIHQRNLGTLVELAIKRQESGNLPEGCRGSIARVREQLESTSLLDSVLGSFIQIGPSLKEFYLSDVLHLMDCLKIEKMRGVTFEFSGKGWAKFHNSSSI